MIALQEKEKSQSNQVESLDIDIVDPNLNLPPEGNVIHIQNNQNNLNNHQLILSQNLKNQNVTQKLSLEFLKELLQDQNLSDAEKEKYEELSKKIATNNNYLYIYNDLFKNDSVISHMVKDNEISTEKPIICDLPDILDYDVEMYKVGQKCGGLKKRYAIVKRGGFFSSSKPIKEMDPKSNKDKTPFLKKSIILNEQFDENQKNQGEWSNKKKPYRIKIIYSKSQQNIDEQNKKDLSQFLLYFDDEKKRKEVNLMLFGISASEEKKNEIKTCIGNLSTLLTKGNKFYTILKILSVKNKIKKRKIAFNKMDDTIKDKIIAKLMIDDKYISDLRNRMTIDVNESKLSVSGGNTLRNVPPPRTNVFEKQYSDFMPLISNCSLSCGKNIYNKEKRKKNQKSLSYLIKKYESLKDEIPPELINENDNNNESLEGGMCFNIPNGVEVVNNEENNNENFGLEKGLCSNSKYIYFNKNKPEIIFKKDNNNEDSQNLSEDEIKDKKLDNSTLTDQNIYEISNVILNANIDMNGKEDNNLIICGPKSNNNKGITYKYMDDNILYLDPENMKIKKKTVNKYNKEEIDGISIQIYQSELDINSHKIQEFLKNITDSIRLVINQDNAKKELLFGYIIKLNDSKIIESNYILPKDFKENICFIEYNKQYFIPNEYKDQDLIIDFYCLPKISFSEKEGNIEEEKRKNLVQLLNPVKVGYAKINYNDIEEGKFKYPIKNNDLDEPNSFVILDGMNDKMDNIALKNIKGKDYSIGSDSYIEKIVDKKFFDEVKDENNKSIPDEIKDKYFNVLFDDEDNFLFRPHEDMNEDEFFEDMKKCGISNDEIDKIKNNKKYTFLPFCEKYYEKDLYESENLKCLSNEQKDTIKNNYNEGDWIYKSPEIKVKLLSKNKGAQNNGISQYIYSTGQSQSFPIGALNQDNEDTDRVIPIVENNFNIFDMNEMSEIEDTDNFQWKTGIKFNDPIQMHSFLKLLTLARQNINTKLKNVNNDLEFDNDKMKEYEKNRNNCGEDIGSKQCGINICFIDFINQFELKRDLTHLYFEIFIEKEGLVIRRLSPYLENTKYDFKNSLLNNVNNEKNSNLLNECKSISSRSNSMTYKFEKKVKLDKNKFNERNKKVSFGTKMNREFTYYNKPQKFEICIETSDKDKFYAPIDTTKIREEKICEQYELPIYMRGDDTKIYGCLGINLYELDDSQLSFQERFEGVNRRYLLFPLLILKEKSNIDIQNYQIENYHFGLNEPNIFRRKILHFIHNNYDIDPNNLDKYGNLDILYQKLYNKCVKLPLPDSFAEFKFYNIKRNFDEEPNSYKKKLALKLLKIVRHEEFLQLFREKEWDLYLKSINKGEEGVSGIVYFKNIPKEQIISENKNNPKTLRDLIYLGIPRKYREDIYSTFLEIDKLYDETRKKLYEKENKDFPSQKNVFSYFADHLFGNQNETNIIFSLIDNDSIFLYSLTNTTVEDVNMIKKIAKSFFIWSELGINLKENEKYVYFIGLLSIIQQLRQYFKDDSLVFWILVGLSQNMDHFHQQNPLYTNTMNYINLYGLVIKLIMETHLTKVYDKFISLNFPIEFFISRHLSTLYTDYFNNELMMRIFDILIYESSFKVINKDNLHYLRILCAIPITLFEINENRILACESVSEIESIFNDLTLHTFNNNKFIITLEKNVSKFFVYSGFFEKWLSFFNKNGKEWDSKRGDLELLISDNFRSVYEENNKYLNNINNIFNGDAQDMYNNYCDKLKDELKAIKSIYYRQESYNDYSSEITGIMIHISKLQQIYNNDNKNTKEYKLFISFENKNDPQNNNQKAEFKIDFDNENNKINNIEDLFYKTHFEEYHFPKYIIFELTDNQNNNIASFTYKIFEYEPMKISKIVLENKEKNIKYFLEFALFKYTTRKLFGDDIEVFNSIFSRPYYLHLKTIEEKLYSYSIDSSFNRKLSSLIEDQNDIRNKILNYNIFNENLSEMFKKFNDINNKEDQYNENKIKNVNRIVLQSISNILNSFIPGEIQTPIKEWLKNGNLSIEEIFYSLILIDKSLISINEKIFLLYSIAQTKDKLLFNNDRLSIDKLKELIYSLYKRFMIYFTKTDVERMIDFLLKDERLFNIKYAFVHNNNDNDKINEFIYDKDHYEPRLDNKRDFEIYFDNIDKKINIYLNHLNNHYNMNCISKDIFIQILTDILKNDSNYNNYQKNKFNTITIVIEKDNLIFKRCYTIKYSPTLVIEEEYSENNIFNVKPKNSEEIGDHELCYEISSFDCTNSYSVDKDISFDRFKELFFKLPYLSDLFRVSFTYINENTNLNEKAFEHFKVTIEYDDDISNSEFKRNPSINSITNKRQNYGIFYFPGKDEEEENINMNIGASVKEINMDDHITISDTVDSIIDKINKKLKENYVKEDLKLIDKISCFIYYYLDENNKAKKEKKKIGFFDRLYSYTELKNKNNVELKVIFNTDLFTFVSNQNLVSRGRAYCKIFYSDKDDFIWKKCSAKPKNITNAKLKSTDYKSKPFLRDDDVVLGFNI